MICPVCKKEIEEGVKFCQHCGAPVVSEEPVVEEQAFIAEEPAFVPEVTATTEAVINETVSDNEVPKSNVDEIVEEALSAHTATAVEEKAEETPVKEENNSGYAEPQKAEPIANTKRRKKLNIPATVAVCIAFGILITAFSAVSAVISSARKTLVRGAISEQIDKLDIGDITVGDTQLADGILNGKTIAEDATVSDVVIVMLEDYEKQIAKGIFEKNNVTVDDLRNMENVDLEAFADKIDGINSVNELDMETIIENISKFDKKEISAIAERYSTADFPELTFEIDKRKVEDLLNESGSPMKDYLCGFVKAYEQYLLTGKDEGYVNEESLNKLSEESVGYVLSGMNSAYIDEINKEMAQVVNENKAQLNSANPSAVFGVFGNILPMSLSTVSIFVALGLAVVFAVVIGIITKRVDAAALTLGISLVITAGACFAVNLVPSNLASITGMNSKIVTVTANELVKETLAGDFTVMGVRFILVGIVIIGAVIAVKLITRAVRNKRTK